MVKPVIGTGSQGLNSAQYQMQNSPYNFRARAAEEVAAKNQPPKVVDDHGAHRGTTLTGHNADGSGSKDGLSGRPGPLINPPLTAQAAGVFLEGRNQVSLQKGFIRRIAQNAGSGANVALPATEQYVFRFLYNPTTIDYGNSTFGGLVPQEYTDKNDYPNVRFPGQETVSFSLMLDRTQEVYNEGLASRGTMVDIDQLYRVINGSAGNVGYLSLSAVEINWGPWQQSGHPVPPFSCYITSVSVTHTQFTPRMCPMRSVVSISAASLVGANNQRAGADARTAAISFGGGS